MRVTEYIPSTIFSDRKNLRVFANRPLEKGRMDRLYGDNEVSTINMTEIFDVEHEDAAFKRLSKFLIEQTLPEQRQSFIDAQTTFEEEDTIAG